MTTTTNHPDERIRVSGRVGSVGLSAMVTVSRRSTRYATCTGQQRVDGCMVPLYGYR